MTPERDGKSSSRTCGLIMPISTMGSYSTEYWSEVLSIITAAVESVDEFDFHVSLVSDADEAGVIQKRIVQKLYSSDIVVCDVSGKNPNVMFALGMRLAFDKPTILVKDDTTDYSFDTDVIEPLDYPRDLRFAKIVNFKALLCQKIAATLKAAETDPEHTTFLKNFGQFRVADISESVASADTILLEQFSEIHQELRFIRSRVIRHSHETRKRPVVHAGLEIKRKINKILQEWEFAGVDVEAFDGDDAAETLRGVVTGAEQFSDQKWREFVSMVVEENSHQQEQTGPEE